MYCVATVKGLVYFSFDGPMGHIMIEYIKLVEQQIGQDSSLQVEKLGK